MIGSGRALVQMQCILGGRALLGGFTCNNNNMLDPPPGDYTVEIWEW